MPLDTASVRMERLNSLMLLLLQDKENTKSRLISILEYQTTRTLERDIQLLRDRYGVEITYDARKKTYQCKDAGQFMLRFSLTKPEVIALAAGLKMAKHFLPHLQSSADAIWEKTARLMPEELLEEGKRLSEATVLSIPVSSLDAAIFQKIIDAASSCTALDITYRSPYKTETSSDAISPWGVYFQSHAWYMWAGGKRHPDGATYRVSRISHLSQSAEPYLPPPEGETVQSYAGTAWFARPGKLKYKIKLHLRMPLAAIVAETKWHPTQRIENAPGGGIIYTATVPDLEEVARWSTSCAPYIEALEPEELRKRMKELGEEVAGRH